MSRARSHRGGHLYFEFVEKGEGDEVRAKLEAVVWRTDLQRIREQTGDDGLADGMEVRCRGNLDLYPPFGRMQFCVREVDADFGMGRLEARRRETIAALAEAGLVELNRSLDLPALPFRLALVTSEESAAYHDFLKTLQESPWGFRVQPIHAAVQGARAEAELSRALRRAAGLPVDCVVLVRGGGARTDLIAFDSRKVAEAVARCPVPVLVGLGHETDRTVSDEVAWRSLKTPTGAASFLVDRVAEADLAVGALRRRLAVATPAALAGPARAIRRLSNRTTRVGERIESTRRRLRGVASRLAAAGATAPRRAATRLGVVRGALVTLAPRLSADSAVTLARHADSLVASARARIAARVAELQGWERLRIGLAPGRTLARGFSITRDSSGRAVRKPTDVEPGDRLTTELAEGTLSSRVEV